MLFAIEDNLVNTQDFAYQAFMIMTCEILMVVFEYGFHELELGSRDGLEHKSAVLSVIEE